MDSFGMGMAMLEMQDAIEKISICEIPQLRVERAIVCMEQNDIDVFVSRWMKEPSRSEAGSMKDKAVVTYKAASLNRTSERLRSKMGNIDSTVSLHLVEHFGGAKLDRNIAGSGWRTMYRRRTEAIDILNEMLEMAIMRYVTLTTNHSERAS